MLVSHRDLLLATPASRVVQHVGEVGTRLYNAACDLGLEGVVAKRGASAYKAAGRSRDWLKIRTPHGRQVQEKRSENWSG